MRQDTPSLKRKLIEVSLPLEAINVESAREKSIRHGHPSTLHLWWARRPLAAARIRTPPFCWAHERSRLRLHDAFEDLRYRLCHSRRPAFR